MTHQQEISINWEEIPKQVTRIIISAYGGVYGEWQDDNKMWCEVELDLSIPTRGMKLPHLIIKDEESL